MSVSIALGDLMLSQAGSVDPSKFPDECFDLYSIPAYDAGQPDVVFGREIGSSKQIVQPGDVLLSRIVPHIRRAWVVGNKRGRRIIASGEWIVFRSDKFDPNYLRYLLVAEPFYARFMQTVAGVGGSLLRARPVQVADIEIPMVRISDQQRVVAQLQEADQLRRMRRYALQMCDGIIPAAFIEMFGELRASKWDKCTLSDITNAFSYGTSTKCSGDKSLNAVLRIPNVIGGNIDIADLKFGPLTEKEKSKLKLQQGDIIFVRTNGNPEYVGRCAVFNLTRDFYFASYLIRARCDLKRVNPVFLAAYLRTPDGRRSMQPSIRTTAGQYNVSIEGLEDVQIIIPPLSLQNKVVASIKAADCLRSVHSESLRQAEHLFQTLLNRAFASHQ